MLAGYLSGALVTLAALAVGQATMQLLGAHRPSVLVPAVGLSILLVVADLAIKLSGRATTAWIALAITTIAAIALLALKAERTGRSDVPPLRTPEQRGDSRVHKGGTSGLAIRVFPALLAAAFAAFAVSIPFLANGRMGPLGAGLVNDDMASHLLFTDWLTTHAGQAPDLVKGGYPLGPHSLVAAIARLASAQPVEAFAGLSFAIAALTALTAYGALDNLRPALRAPAAALSALPYLGAAYFAQGAFKEPMMALFVLAFALGLPPLRAGLRGAGWGAVVPLGLIAAGALYNYSFPGEAWLVGTALAWGAIELLREARSGGRAPLRARVGAAWPLAAIAVGVLVLAALPEIGRLIDFTGFNAFDPEHVGTRIGLGNLRHPLTPLEGFNVWPSSEFRISASSASAPAALFYLGALLGIAALAWGVAAALRRRESALPGALLAGAGAYVAAVLFGTPYTSAKALAIVAPVAMLVALRGLLDGRSEQVLKRLAAARIPLAIAFVAGAAVSSFLPLRSAAVGPSTHADEIKSFRPLIRDRRVLFLGRDQFAADELIGSKVGTPILNHYNQKSVGNRYPPSGDTVKLDFDAVTPQILDTYAFAITTTAAYQSAAPRNFVVAKTTPDYTLWRRQGPTPPRQTLSEPNSPGAILDCATPQGRAAAHQRGTASVIQPPPVVGSELGWRPSSRVTDARPASQELTLTPGRWSISLQYVATQPLRVTAAGLSATLPASLDFRGPAPFWRVGEIDVSRRAPVRFSLSVARPPRFGRLLRVHALAFPQAIAATPARPEERLPLRRACGRYVDFISPAG